MLRIIVGKDGRPSMGGVFNKLQNRNSKLLVRRRLRSRRTGNLIRDFWREYNDSRRPYSNERGHYNRVDINQQTLSFNDGAIIRWGNSMSLNLGSQVITYNSATAVGKASDKRRTREILHQKGISVPKIINSISQQITAFPVIARPRSHAKGRNFLILRTQQEFENHFRVNYPRGWYYAEFVDKVKEFRVHCAHGRILNYLEKPNPGGNNIAWNRAGNGTIFNNVRWDDYNSEVARTSLKAVEALGLDFAGVDIMLDNQGKAYVLELNTGPTLNSSEYSMSRYAMYFDWLAKDTSQRRPHWPIPEEGFRRAKNYAWHNFHFEDREPNNR